MVIPNKIIIVAILIVFIVMIAIIYIFYRSNVVQPVDVSKLAHNAVEESIIPVKTATNVVTTDVSTTSVVKSPQEEQQTANPWITEHNAIRQQINYSQKNNPVKWNPVIAEGAQSYSQKCQFQHSPASSRTLNGAQLGENLATGAPYSNYNEKAIVDMWNSEKQYYKYPNYPDQETGHYTQIINKNVTEIGCGCSKCSNLMPNNTKLCVCRYNPGQLGNQPPY